MKRIIKDFKSAPSEVLSLITQQYPFGYDDSHLVNFVNSKGEYIHALEVKTDDSIYLIKQDRNLDQHFNDILNPEADIALGKKLEQSSEKLHLEDELDDE